MTTRHQIFLEIALGHSKEEKAGSHSRILDVAASQFKSRGFNGIGLAELMEQAGLTHGGFYKHFASRDALVAESVAHAFALDRERFVKRMEFAKGDKIAIHIDEYLSLDHRDQTALGCSMAALGVDASRASDEVKAVFQENFQLRRDWLASELGGPKAKAQRHAVTIITAMLGAVTAARAMADPEFSGQLLDTARKEIHALVKRLRSELSAA